MTDDAEPKNGRVSRFALIRGYVLLVLGAAMILYGVFFSKPINAALLTAGGSLLGVSPLMKAAQAASPK